MESVNLKGNGQIIFGCTMINPSCIFCKKAEEPSSNHKRSEYSHLDCYIKDLVNKQVDARLKEKECHATSNDSNN